MALFFCTVAFVTPLYFNVAKSSSLFSALGPLPSSKCKEQIYVSFEICSSFWKSLRPHRQKLPTFSLLSLIFRLILFPQTHVVTKFSRLWKTNEKIFPPAFDLDIGNPHYIYPNSSVLLLWHSSNNSGNNFLATVLCIKKKKKTMLVRISIPWCFVTRRHDLFLSSEENAIPRTADNINSVV